MSRWGIDEYRIAAALAAVRPQGNEEWAVQQKQHRWVAPESTTPESTALEADSIDHDDFSALDELFSRAIWGVLVEPGDSVAGLLIGAVGPVAAAHMVINRVAAETVSQATRGEVTPERAHDGMLRWRERLRSTDVLRSLDSAARCSARMIVPGDAHWPEGLKALGEGAPILLWARGDVELLRRPAVAIVGARAATGYGEHVAMELAAGLCSRDVVVVSGGAYGIDGMAHRAALASGGATIAVLAGGIDRFYPAGHEALLTRVVEKGLLLSEVACGTAPTKWRFLQRNRLIAAIAEATVVVEAGRRSGSLNTARHALHVGRPVGIVPGPVTSAASAGCHAFLRDEPATCVTSVSEIMQLAFGEDGVLPIPDRDAAALAGANFECPADPLQVRVIDALRPRRGQNPSEIARAVGEDASRIRGVLGVLELDGTASLGDDGLWRGVAAARKSKSAVAANSAIDSQLADSAARES